MHFRVGDYIGLSRYYSKEEKEKFYGRKLLVIESIQQGWRLLVKNEDGETEYVFPNDCTPWDITDYYITSQDAEATYLGRYFGDVTADWGNTFIFNRVISGLSVGSLRKDRIFICWGAAWLNKRGPNYLFTEKNNFSLFKG